MSLFADRMSTESFRGNQLRLYLSTFAYTLLLGLNLDPVVDRHERPFFRGRIEEKLTEILKDSAQHGTPSGF